MNISISDLQVSTFFRQCHQQFCASGQNFVIQAKFHEDTIHLFLLCMATSKPFLHPWLNNRNLQGVGQGLLLLKCSDGYAVLSPLFFTTINNPLKPCDKHHCEC